MKKIIIAALMVAVFAVAGCTGKKNKQQTEQQQTKMEKQEVAIKTDSIAQEPVFDIVTTMGTIRVKLYSDTPKHRDNFVKLATKGFFNGILFHRVIAGFMIQTGDPNTKTDSTAATWGQGGPGYTIPAEIVTTHTHKKGALAAARKGDTSNPERASSGSQFYIVASEAGCSHLNGEYTVFGETLSGLEVVDAISQVATNQRNMPLKSIKITAVNLVQ